jgi:hypothetical protein
LYEAVNLQILNPFEDHFTVNVANAKAGNALFYVTDISGRIISTKSYYLPTDNYNFQLPLTTPASLPGGLYFLKAYINNKLITQKIQKN